MNPYRGLCGECGREIELPAGLSPGVLREDGSVRPVREREYGARRRKGESATRIWWQGRFVDRSLRFCEACGGRYESREIGAPAMAGCMPSLCAALLAAIAAGAAYGSLWLGVGVFCAGAPSVYLLLLWASGAIARGRARRAGRSVADLACCEAPEPVALDRLKEGRHRCAGCGEKAVTFTYDPAKEGELDL